MIADILYHLKLLFSPNKEFYAFLRKQLNIRPQNIKLYEVAFLHKSASVTLPNKLVVNNERLEYLGDAIIDAIIADYLFRRYPKEREGFLTQMRSKIVSRAHLDSIASKMNLMTVLASNVHSEVLKKRICGDTFEALIGAMYLDLGYKKTRKYMTGYVLKNYVNLKELMNTEVDFKSRLIEWGQKYKLQIRFETTEKNDTAYASKFAVTAIIGDIPISTGDGRSKKEAEQKASQQALTYISTSAEFSTDALSQYIERAKN